VRNGGRAAGGIKIGGEKKKQNSKYGVRGKNRKKKKGKRNCLEQKTGGIKTQDLRQEQKEARVPKNRLMAKSQRRRKTLKMRTCWKKLSRTRENETETTEGGGKRKEEKVPPQKILGNGADQGRKKKTISSGGG